MQGLFIPKNSDQFQTRIVGRSFRSLRESGSTFALTIVNPESNDVPRLIPVTKIALQHTLHISTTGAGRNDKYTQRLRSPTAVPLVAGDTVLGPPGTKLAAAPIAGCPRYSAVTLQLGPWKVH